MKKDTFLGNIIIQKQMYTEVYHNIDIQFYIII